MTKKLFVSITPLRAKNKKCNINYVNFTRFNEIIPEEVGKSQRNVQSVLPTDAYTQP